MKQSLHPVYIIQGAQWGSEGKGQIAALFCQLRQASAIVRTGSVNAGHTVYHNGKPYKMQLIPTGWVEPSVELHLGPGAYIHREILAREVMMIKEATGEDIRPRLFIDYRAGVHSLEHEGLAKESGRHVEMGATGKGSSEAVIGRMLARGSIMKGAQEAIFANAPVADGLDFRSCLCDSPARLLDTCLPYGPVVLEGTQGAHLDLYLGPYPFTTNRPVSTAAWLAYAGLPPTLDIRPVLVARTYPIRVAGNSGPMPEETLWNLLYQTIHERRGSNEKVPELKDETIRKYENALATRLLLDGVPRSYHTLTAAQQYKYRKTLSEAPTAAFLSLTPREQDNLALFFEMTTVTKKIRRVSNWHIPTVREAIRMNGCHELWITFLNYRYPAAWGRTTTEGLPDRCLEWLSSVVNDLGVSVGGVSTERYPECHLPLFIPSALPAHQT